MLLEPTMNYRWCSSSCYPSRRTFSCVLYGWCSSSSLDEIVAHWNAFSLAEGQLNRGKMTHNCRFYEKQATNNPNGQSKGIQRHAQEISIETFALNNNFKKKIRKVRNKTGVSNSPAIQRQQGNAFHSATTTTWIGTGKAFCYSRTESTVSNMGN